MFHQDKLRLDWLDEYTYNEERGVLEIPKWMTLRQWIDMRMDKERAQREFKERGQEFPEITLSEPCS